MPRTRKRTQRVPHPHLQYAADVAAGRVIAGQLVRRACEATLFRHDERSTQWEYRPDFAQPVLDFLAEVPHVEGEWAARGERLTLQPWQQFFVCEVWGWRGRDNPRLRRYSEAYLEVGKKNGKTALVAALQIYELLYGDTRAQVYSAATVEDQAMLSWNVAKLMIQAMPDNIVGDVKIDHRTIQDTSDGSYMVALTGKPKDGLNPSFVLYDEIAAVTNREQVEVLTDAFGARQGGALIGITTATGHRNTIWREKRSRMVSLLMRGELPDRALPMLYCIDPKDKPANSRHWPKANPNLGVSKSREFMSKLWDEAQDTPGAVPDFLRKQLCVYVEGAEQWLQPKFWDQCVAPRVYRQGHCYIGVDMGATSDLCAVARIWDRGGARLDVDWQSWVAEGALQRIEDPDLQRIYTTAAKNRQLVIWPDEMISLTAVHDYLQESLDRYDVQQIGHDPYRAGPLFEQLAQDGYPVLRVPQSRVHMGPAKARLEGLLRTKRLRYRANDFLRWQFENTHIRRDMSWRGNDVLSKGDSKDLKIDGIVALAIATRGLDAGITAPEPSFAVVAL